MYNCHRKQFVFRQSDGDVQNFFMDARQNLCCCTLLRSGVWSSPTVLHKNVFQDFYAEMDQGDRFHLLFQDQDGSLHYSLLSGKTASTIPVLNSKTPSAYDKQLYIAPFGNDPLLFYVLQHGNSFILAYQLLAGGRAGSPRVVDYVSGSSIPCSLLYDNAQNIYAFYQSYDGRYLQLGYKKYSTRQKNWSDFTPVTKYAGNCEYPHVLIDERGIMHLCYQRRAPKLFEMVYQQKAPDKNLWSGETIVHSSVHSFENASILTEGDNIVAYWVRDDVIYCNSASGRGTGEWGKAVRYNFPSGYPLQCISYKSNSPRDKAGAGGGKSGGALAGLPGEAADGRFAGLNGAKPEDSESAPPAPAVYPGSVSSGLKLAFTDRANLINSIGDFAADGFHAFPPSRDRQAAGASASSHIVPDARSLILDTFKQLQGSIEEVQAGWSSARDELSKLSNAYVELSKELAKSGIRMNILEKQLRQLKKLNSAENESARDSFRANDGRKANETDAENTSEIKVPSEVKNASKRRYEPKSEEADPAGARPVDPQPAKITPGPSDPDIMKEWEQWQEPKEWQGGS